MNRPLISFMKKQYPTNIFCLYVLDKFLEGKISLTFCSDEAVSRIEVVVEPERK